MPDKRRWAGADLRGRLTTPSVFQSSGHEHLTGSLVVPLFDEHGTVSELHGGKIRDGLRPGTPLHLYSPGPHRGVWNEPTLAASEEIVLCESIVDALSLWCAGFRHDTASYGTEGFTPCHAEALARNNVRRILIGFDTTPAGNRAAQSLATSLLAEGSECFRFQLPAGQDLNDVAVAVRNPTDVLGRPPMSTPSLPQLLGLPSTSPLTSRPQSWWGARRSRSHPRWSHRPANSGGHARWCRSRRCC